MPFYVAWLLYGQNGALSELKITHSNLLSVTTNEKLYRSLGEQIIESISYIAHWAFLGKTF